VGNKYGAVVLRLKKNTKNQKMSNFYNFKKVQVVPNGTEFIDIVLSKINRKVSFLIERDMVKEGNKEGNSIKE
jgi:hypothetical protein